MVFSRDELKQYEVASAVRRRPAAALVHRRRPRPAAADPGHARRRLRDPRRRAEAGATRPSTTRSSASQTNVARVAERGRGRDRLRREARWWRSPPTRRPARSTCTARPSWPPTRCSSSANHYAAGARHPVLGGPLRQRDGQPRLGGPALPRLAAGAASLPITDTRMTRFWITLDAGRASSCVDSLRPDAAAARSTCRGSRSMRIIDLAEAVAPGRRARRDRHPAGREAARGDDQRPTTAAATLRLGDRYVVAADDRDLGLRRRRPSGEPVPRGLRLPRRTPTTGGSSVDELRDDARERTADVMPVRPAVDRRRRHRRGGRGAAWRLADHRARGRRVRGRPRRLDRRRARVAVTLAAPRPCTWPTRRPGWRPATRWSPRP